MGSVPLVQFPCVNTLSILSLLTAAPHDVVLILTVILCTVTTWEPFDDPCISPNTSASGKQGINKKQQEQAGAEYKTNTSKTSSAKAVQTFKRCKRTAKTFGKNLGVEGIEPRTSSREWACLPSRVWSNALVRTAIAV